MKPPMLKSVEEFSESMIEFSEYHEWHDIAYIIDGYEILKEMGFHDSQAQVGWKKEKFRMYERDQKWNLSTIELLILLFLEDRRIRFVIAGEKFDVINSLLIEVAQQTNNNYEPNEETRKYIEGLDRKKKEE